MTRFRLRSWVGSTLFVVGGIVGHKRFFLVAIVLVRCTLECGCGMRCTWLSVFGVLVCLLGISVFPNGCVGLFVSVDLIGWDGAVCGTIVGRVVACGSGCWV